MFKAKDISGKRFGKLTAIEPVGKNSRRQTIWRCKCDCGNIVDLPIGALTTGNTKSCGCLRNGVFRGGSGTGSSQPEDLSGRKFGHLTAIRIVGKDRSRATIWECACECGNTVQVRAKSLKNGDTTNCGCLRGEHHDIADNRLYMVWSGMKQRCQNKNHRSYPWYGGRGISVCDEWARSFLAFKEWADKCGYDANAPRGVCTIDRVDPDGDYCPENCRWISIEEQQANKRRE